MCAPFWILIRAFSHHHIINFGEKKTEKVLNYDGEVVCFSRDFFYFYLCGFGFTKLLKRYESNLHPDPQHWVVRLPQFVLEYFCFFLFYFNLSQG